MTHDLRRWWGTPNLDFASFNKAGQSILAHGDEAIIPRGSGHELASEIAKSLPQAANGSPQNINVTVQAIDGASVERFVRSPAFKRSMTSALQDNANDFGVAVGGALGRWVPE